MLLAQVVNDHMIDPGESSLGIDDEAAAAKYFGSVQNTMLKPANVCRVAFRFPNLIVLRAATIPILPALGIGNSQAVDTNGYKWSLWVYNVKLVVVKSYDWNSGQHYFFLPVPNMVRILIE